MYEAMYVDINHLNDNPLFIDIDADNLSVADKLSCVVILSVMFKFLILSLSNQRCRLLCYWGRGHI